METIEFKACTDSDRHKASGSRYPQEQVPINLFKKDKFGIYSRTCEDCRKYIYKSRQNGINKHKKFVEETNAKLIAENQLFRCCHERYHKNSKSLYPIDKVPIELFKKKTPGDLYKNCLDCRMYKNEHTIKRRAKNKEIIEELNNKSAVSGEEFRFCIEEEHNSYGSPYPASRVPIELFRTVPDNPKSELKQTCSHCRDFCSVYEKHRTDYKRIEAEAKGLSLCSTCKKERQIDNIALNNDGTNSASCKDCKIREKNRVIKLNICFNMLKLEFIVKYQSSCYKCNNIYLLDKINNIAIDLPTYMLDDVRYVKFDHEIYTSAEFIKLFSNQLEMNILQFDHLTEEEQRERGMLLSHEVFVPKKYNVGSANSESAMKLEAHKCQLVCARCHLKETMRRECGSIPKDYATREKRSFTNKLKLSGCENCKYQNSDLPRFFHFDHINPNNKITEIARMVTQPTYTIEDIKIEISKCRILCHHCHIIHTRKQWDTGIISSRIKTKSVVIEECTVKDESEIVEESEEIK